MRPGKTFAEPLFETEVLLYTIFQERVHWKKRSFMLKKESMSQPQKLSLLSAILINLNIMLGSGIFINTVILTKQAGSLGAVVYLLVALLLLPLIMTIGQLLDYHPTSGTFYDFGRTISPYFGFISSWSYFTAKLCSSALAIHVCLSFLQQIIPVICLSQSLTH
jgi:amino acid permease